MSEEEKEIEDLVKHFLTGTINENVRKQLIDNLAAYGNKAIEPIHRCISDPSIQNEELKIYALDTIKRIKES